VKKPTFFLLAALMVFLAAFPASAVKYMAVVETEVDAQSGAKINKAEVRQITAVLRAEAVKNLPKDKYNIMTAETVIAQGSAKLEECAEENCVITLGNKIGADYIVRGIISKLGANLTISVEMYETVDGNLVESSSLVRAGNVTELLDRAAGACAEMYKRFEDARKAPITYTITTTINPANGGTVSRDPDQISYTPGTVVSVTATPTSGYEFTGWSGASSSKNTTLKAPIDRNLTLTANFDKQTPTYKYSSPESGQNQTVGYIALDTPLAGMFIATLPPMAEVYVNGRFVGTSNGGELKVPVGTHIFRFVKNGVEKAETITVSPGKNPTMFVNLK